MPALAKLKLVFGLELTGGGLTGPGRVRALPGRGAGPEGERGRADDARITLSIPRTMFALLAEEGELADWRDAFHYGHLKVDGDPRVKRLLGKAIAGDLSARRRLARRAARSSFTGRRPSAIPSTSFGSRARCRRRSRARRGSPSAPAPRA